MSPQEGRRLGLLPDMWHETRVVEQGRSWCRTDPWWNAESTAVLHQWNHLAAAGP